MPVLTLMVWDFVACEAWPSSVAVRRGSMSDGKSPPSRLMAIWILVSLVSRAMAAQRGGCGVMAAIVAVLIALSREICGVVRMGV